MALQTPRLCRITDCTETRTCQAAVADQLYGPCDGPLFDVTIGAERPGFNGYLLVLCLRHMNQLSFHLDDATTAKSREHHSRQREATPPAPAKPTASPKPKASPKQLHTVIDGYDLVIVTPAKKLPRHGHGVDFGVERKLLLSYDGRSLVWSPGGMVWQGIGSTGYQSGHLDVCMTKDLMRISNREVEIVDCDAIGYEGPTRLATLLELPELRKKIAEALQLDKKVADKILDELRQNRTITLRKV